MDLIYLGWNHTASQYFAPYSEQGYCAGRVTAEHKQLYTVYTEIGEVPAQVSGKMRYRANGRVDYPAVGDWVVISLASSLDKALIHAILPRQSKFSRKAAGNAVEEQIIAANIETVFLVNSLNNDFNLRRIERYLALSWESGANPVIILSKADLCEEPGPRIREVEGIAFGIPVHVISCFTGQGLNELSVYFKSGNTVALLGSSGAGKSTLINSLIGSNVQKVEEVRQGDDKGRHTTTSRELIILPQGGLIIDTPGMRELQLWGSEDGLGNVFDDIEALAAGCRFSDCKHQTEPGCMVAQALSDGTLSGSRYQSYLKLQKELAYLSDQQEYLEQKEKLRKSYRHVKHRRT